MCISTSISIHIHSYTSPHTYIHYINMHTCTYTYIYTHTYNLTHTKDIHTEICKSVCKLFRDCSLVDSSSRGNRPVESQQKSNN